MQVKDIMKKEVSVSCCGMSIMECANLMVKNDCGEIPVVASHSNKKILGVITDRDITCRVVAEGVDPSEAKVVDYMTKHIHTVKKEDDVERCYQLMSEHQVRRLPVVDENMNCIGIISQSHTIRHADEHKVGKLAKDFVRNKEEESPTQNVVNF